MRTHELIVRRLQAKGWGHVLFHGGVPGEKRAALIDRFIEDPGCRLFLSTDPGGVGLNQQHAAATIVNMDLPWNPAVLEQRVGRVDWLGQTRSVQVVNLVAQGTIEDGMLSVLAFKKSLFAGVLEGGKKEIFLHGTRLSKFMESVEEATGTMGEAEVAEEPAGINPSAPRRGWGGTAMERPAAPPADPWAPLLAAGLKLVETWSAGRSGETPATPSWIETDTRTGQSYLKLPVPEPEAVQRFADALTGLLAGFRKP